jgi:PAS domain S-box-containing protein
MTRVAVRPPPSAPALVAVLDRIGDGVTIQDDAGRLVYANAAAAPLLGFATAAELLAAPASEVLARCSVFDECESPVPVDQIPARRVRSGDEEPEVLLRVRSATTKEERWVGFRAVPLVAADGARLVVNIFRDVTDQVQAENEARERLARNRAILAALPDLLFLQAPDGTYLDYHAGNPAQLLVSPEVFLGKSAAEILPPQVADQLVPAVERTADTGTPSSEHYTLEVSGDERFFEARIVRADDGNVLSIVRDVTDRVRTEEALAASRHLADLVATASPAILFVYDQIDDRNVYVNDAISRVLGYTPEQVERVRDSFMRGLMHPDDLVHLPAMAAQMEAAADGEVVEHAYRLRHAEGGWRWLATRITVFTREPTGRPRLVVGAALDVTTPRETDLALRESEARYRAVVESQTEMICRYLPGTPTFTFVNDAYCRTVRRTKEELLGRSILEIVPASDHARLETYFQSLVADPRSDEIEHPIVLPDGTVGLQHWVDRPIYDAAGNLVEFQGIGRDVTALRRAEAALRASEAQLRLALENAAMGTWDWQVDAEWVAWSEHTGPLFGLPVGTPGLAIREYYALVHPDDRKRIREIDRRRAADGRPYAAEFRVVWPDGTPRWLESKCRAVAYDGNGRVTRFLGVTMDITERKRSEEALRELSGRLLSVQDEERRRLARDLHEQTAQTLVALSLDLGTVRQRLGTNGDPAVDRLLAEAQTLGQQVLQEIRTISYVLHPPALDDAGLAATLREYAEGFSRRSGVTVDLSGVHDVGRLPEEAEGVLLRVAQEALVNVARHAGTDRATLTLSTRPGSIVMRIADNGRGIAAIESSGDSTPLGVGIAGMRERLRQLSGELEIVSNAGGTAVTARLPLGRHNDVGRHSSANRCVASAGSNDQA